MFHLLFIFPASLTFQSHREIAVLSEISHPRIVRLLDSIEDTNDGTTWSPYCMILSYCKGPTVEGIINHGGALGIHMAQEISYQLIDAVSYLNGHAVIHRDIKVRKKVKKYRLTVAPLVV